MNNRILYVDIIDKCNLRCPTCARGTQLIKNSSNSMSIDVFKRIVDKAKVEGYKRIGFFNWIEPFLIKDLNDFVSIVKERALFVELSSNLSLKPENNIDFICKVLKSGVNLLTISVSGFEQETYTINHVGGNLFWVKENIEQIARLKRLGDISTDITLRFLEFGYNSGEKTALNNYAKSLGVDFETIEGVGDPHVPVNTYASEDTLLDRINKVSPTTINNKNGMICSLITDTMAIDCQGECYVCCAYPYYPSLRIGSYLEMPEEEIQLKRYSHPICNSCEMYRPNAVKKDRNGLVRTIKSRLGQIFSKDR